jgi:hypothetical protein
MIDFFIHKFGTTKRIKRFFQNVLVMGIYFFNIFDVLYRKKKKAPERRGP